MPNKEDKIPEFIRLRGCINCDASKHHKEETGFDYGYNHTGVVKCLFLGCCDSGHDLQMPFYDPAEMVRLAKKDGRPEAIRYAREYCLYVKERYGHFYEKIGVSIDDILKPLEDQKDSRVIANIR